MKALLSDGWTREQSKGAVQAFRQPEGRGKRRVTMHVHPKKTMGAKLLKGLITDIGWDEADLRRVRLIK